jgi:glutathione S-transferase
VPARCPRTSRCTRPVWRSTAVKAPTKTHKLDDGTDYYSINPLGYVPLLELDDGTRLREGPAIVQYIADQVPAKNLAPANGTLARYKPAIVADLHRHRTAQELRPAVQSRHPARGERRHQGRLAAGSNGWMANSPASST